MGFEAVFDDLLSQDFCYFCGLPFIMWVNLAKKKVIISIEMMDRY